MFMKTIAVGPLELVASRVTGGATVAIDCFCNLLFDGCGNHKGVGGVAANFATEACEARFVSSVIGLRRAMFDVI